jgi:hypothetical protein
MDDLDLIISVMENLRDVADDVLPRLIRARDARDKPTSDGRIGPREYPTALVPGDEGQTSPWSRLMKPRTYLDAKGKPTIHRLELDEDSDRLRIDDDWIPFGGGDKTTYLRKLLKVRKGYEAERELVANSHPARVRRSLPREILDIIDVRRGRHGGVRFLPEYLVEQ